jgi:hypothetical protein
VLEENVTAIWRTKRFRVWCFVVVAFFVAHVIANLFVITGKSSSSLSQLVSSEDGLRLVLFAVGFPLVFQTVVFGLGVLLLALSMRLRSRTTKSASR